jgi:hypothetical protein
VPAVRAVLYLATDALPVLLKGVVPLDERLELEALAGIPDFLSA